jgi:hypothetical protein
MNTIRPGGAPIIVDSGEDSSETAIRTHSAFIVESSSAFPKPDCALRMCMLGDSNSDKRRLLHSIAMQNSHKVASLQDALFESLCGYVLVLLLVGIVVCCVCVHDSICI